VNSATRGLLFAILLFIADTRYTWAGPGTCPGPSVEAPRTWSMRFDLREGFLIVVDGQIGSLEHLKFILDTGASRTMVSNKVASRLSVPRQESTLFNFDRQIATQSLEISAAASRSHPSQRYPRDGRERGPTLGVCPRRRCHHRPGCPRSDRRIANRLRLEGRTVSSEQPDLTAPAAGASFKQSRFTCSWTLGFKASCMVRCPHRDCLPWFCTAKLFARFELRSQESVMDAPNRLWWLYTLLPDFVIDSLERTPRASDRYFFWSGRGQLESAVRS